MQGVWEVQVVAAEVAEEKAVVADEVVEELRELEVRVVRRVCSVFPVWPGTARSESIAR